MYADRMGGRRFNPGSLVVAMGINGVLVGALIYAGPNILPVPPRPPLEAITVYTPPPPPPPEPVAEPRPNPRNADPAPAPQPRPEVSESLATSGDTWVLPPGPPQPAEPGPVEGSGTGVGPVTPPAPPPVLVGPAIDPGAEYQPAYPPSERRAERDGRVVVRVLVGADGRVRQVERVSATSDAFWRVTEAQALRRWRFRPGTKDGVPVEAWRTMAIRFEMTE